MKERLPARQPFLVGGIWWLTGCISNCCGRFLHLVGM